MNVMRGIIGTKSSSILRLNTAILFLLSAVGSAHASLTPAGVVDIGGTGFGAVNTILTYQGTGPGMGATESGCVGVKLGTPGTLDDTGPSLCQGGNLGGDEKPPEGFPHNQTFLVSNAYQIGLVFNADQPAGSQITLSKLTLTLYNRNGQVGFTSGLFSDVTLNRTQPGIGNSGFLFVLDPTQAALANAAINLKFDYLGLSATDTSASGGPETFFLTTVTPEPSSFLLFGTGILVLGTRIRRRMTA
jgi:hypothetical protein